MTPNAAKERVLEALAAAWAGLGRSLAQLALPEIKFEPSPGVPHGIVTIRHIASDQRSQGSEGMVKIDRHYLLVVEVVEIGGRGSGVADATAAALNAALQGKLLYGPGPTDQVIIGVGEPDEQLDNDGTWCRLRLSIPYQFEDVM